MTSPKIIAVSGKLRHGKDTFANLILEYLFVYSIPCVKLAFADPIKKAAQEMFPQLTYSDLWGPSEFRSNIIEGYVNPEDQTKSLTIRDVLTQIGKWGRKTNEDCWVNATMIPAIENLNKGISVVISDCRFKNEKSKIENSNGAVIRIIRPSIKDSSVDASEIDLDGVTSYDRIVLNNTLEDLNGAAKAVVYDHFGIKVKDEAIL